MTATAASVVARAGGDDAETFPAASKAATLYSWALAGSRPVSDQPGPSTTVARKPSR